MLGKTSRTSVIQVISFVIWENTVNFFEPYLERSNKKKKKQPTPFDSKLSLKILEKYPKYLAYPYSSFSFISFDQLFNSFTAKHSKET